MAAALRTDVPTALPDEQVAAVRERVGAIDGRVAVVNDAGVIIGTLTDEQLASADDARVEDVMREGPTTVRPSEEIDDLTERMEGANVPAIFVTTPSGKLLGIFER